MAASPRWARIGGAHGFYRAPTSGRASTSVGRWRRSARVRPLIALSAAIGCLVGAAPAAGSVVISIQGDAIVVRGTEAASFLGIDGGTGGEVRFDQPAAASVDPPSGTLIPPAEPIEAGPGCASRTEPYDYRGRYPAELLGPAGMPIGGVPTVPPRIFFSCPTAGIARVDVDLGDGPNTLMLGGAVGFGSAAQPLPPPLSLLYRGGSGVDQVGESVPGVAMNSGSVVDGGGGDDKLFGAGGRYLGGSGNDTITVHDLARDGAGERTVADGGDGDDEILGYSRQATDPRFPVYSPEGHLIGGAGRDSVNGLVVEGGEGDDWVQGTFVDAGAGDDTIGLAGKALRCGTGVDRWQGGTGHHPGLSPRLVHADCPPYLNTLPQLGAMRFDRSDRLMVPLRFSQAVRVSAEFVNFGRTGHAFVHRLRLQIPAGGRLVRLPIKPKALEVMRSRGRRAYVAIHLTARDAEGERYRARGQGAIEGWALRRKHR